MSDSNKKKSIPYFGIFAVICAIIVVVSIICLLIGVIISDDDMTIRSGKTAGVTAIIFVIVAALKATNDTDDN